MEPTIFCRERIPGKLEHNPFASLPDNKLFFICAEYCDALYFGWSFAVFVRNCGSFSGESLTNMRTLFEDITFQRPQICWCLDLEKIVFCLFEPRFRLLQAIAVRILWATFFNNIFNFPHKIFYGYYS